MRFKPYLVVSNGDVLWNKGFEHYLVGVGIWLPATFGLAWLSSKIFPQEYQNAEQQGTYPAWSLLAAVFLFFALILLPLQLTLSLIAMILASIFLAARRYLRANGHS